MPGQLFPYANNVIPEQPIVNQWKRPNMGSVINTLIKEHTMRTECMDEGTLFHHRSRSALDGARAFLGELFASAARGLESITKAHLLDRARQETLDAARRDGGEISAYAMRTRRLP
jgi:hypothetical protein